MKPSTAWSLEGSELHGGSSSHPVVGLKELAHSGLQINGSKNLGGVLLNDPELGALVSKPSMIPTELNPMGNAISNSLNCPRERRIEKELGKRTMLDTSMEFLILI